MTSYIEHRNSDQPQWTAEALEKLVPPWAVTSRRSLHLTAREVDPTRCGHGRPNRKFPLPTREERAKERTLGKGTNLLEAQAGTWRCMRWLPCVLVARWSQTGVFARCRASGNRRHATAAAGGYAGPP